MAQAAKIDFELREVTEALLVRQGIKEGRWQLAFDLQVAVGTFGPTPKEARPGAMMQIARLSLLRVHDGEATQSSEVVDASELGT